MIGGCPRIVELIAFYLEFGGQRAPPPLSSRQQNTSWRPL
jgi:hypothetical protein